MFKKRVTFSMLFGLALIIWIVSSPGFLKAAVPAIGMAITSGSVEVNRAASPGSATIFEGSKVVTAAASTQIRLNDGVRLRFAPDTHATVYSRRLVLETGYGQIESAPGYAVEARSLRISPADKDSVVRVRLGGERKVMVAAVTGTVHVRNAAGILVATIASGNVLDFEPQSAGAVAPTRASGCLLEKGGKLVLADQTTNVILEITGAGLDAEIGNRVEVTGIAEDGKPIVKDASQVVKVVSLKRVSKGGCSAVAKKIGATATAGAVAASAGTAAGAGAAGGAAAAGAGAAAAGIGVGTVAVIGGVAAAATVGGMAAAGSLPGQGETPSASR